MNAEEEKETEENKEIPGDESPSTDIKNDTDDNEESGSEEPFASRLVVEDGTGIADSNSYVSVDFADSYFSARGVSQWADLEEGKKEAALILATDYIDNIFQWRGKKMTAEQALRFPRSGIADYEGNEIHGVPANLKQAVCDAAILSADGKELFQTSKANGDVVSENITSLSFTYSKERRETTDKTLYDSINTKLRGLYRDSGKNRIVAGKVQRV